MEWLNENPTQTGKRVVLSNINVFEFQIIYPKK